MKKVATWPIVIFLLLGIFVSTSYYGIYNLQKSFTENGVRLGAVNQANQIASYVKRAEGHLMMYLLLGDEVDNGKFYQRLASMDEYADAFMIEQPEFAEDYARNRAEVIRLGELLIALKKSSDQANPSYPRSLKAFHEHSSSIRKAAVAFVETTARLPQATIQYTLNDIVKMYVLLISMGIICIVLIVLLINKRSSELELSRTVADRLDKLSNTDGLTGIGNRRKFDSTFDSEWKRAVRDKTRLGLLLIDIDQFKKFNDCYGHQQGDECLIAVAKALSGSLKRSADAIFRYGGEEFAAVLPNTDDAKAVAETCRKAVEKLAIPHRDINGIVTTSIGVCNHRITHDADPGAFFEHADQALYRAKNSGRNKVCCNSDEIAPESFVSSIK